MIGYYLTPCLKYGSIMNNIRGFEEFSFFVGGRGGQSKGKLINFVVYKMLQ